MCKKNHPGQDPWTDVGAGHHACSKQVEGLRGIDAMVKGYFLWHQRFRAIEENTVLRTGVSRRPVRLVGAFPAAPIGPRCYPN